MNLTINFFGKPTGPGVLPILISCPSGDFPTLEDARLIAFGDADRPTIMAHSILIESTDDASISETWVRDGNNWKSTDATGP
jgi:hypothetical protein